MVYHPPSLLGTAPENPGGLSISPLDNARPLELLLEELVPDRGGGGVEGGVGLRGDKELTTGRAGTCGNKLGTIFPDPEVINRGGGLGGGVGVREPLRF
jgi:hypothetical protein